MIQNYNLHVQDCMYYSVHVQKKTYIMYYKNYQKVEDVQNYLEFWANRVVQPWRNIEFDSIMIEYPGDNINNLLNMLLPQLTPLNSVVIQWLLKRAQNRTTTRRELQEK